MTLTVVSPGFTTVQDLGRPGHGRSGVPPSGAMDPWALRAANRLCGNPDDAAGLEITLAGPALRFEVDAHVALTGGRFAASVDGADVPSWESFAVPAGATLAIGRAGQGARAWLAIAGGIDVPVVLGSRSTHTGAGFGGHEGRMLAAGDRLAVRGGSGPRRRMTPPPPRDALRVLDGPQRDGEGRDVCDRAFSVSPRSDRVGVRLEEALRPPSSGEIDPEPTVTGAIQVPPDGRPIVLGPDRGVTGGYPVVAVVIGADIGGLAHARPGDTLRFERVDASAARTARLERERLLDEGIEEWT